MKKVELRANLLVSLIQETKADLELEQEGRRLAEAERMDTD